MPDVNITTCVIRFMVMAFPSLNKPVCMCVCVCVCVCVCDCVHIMCMRASCVCLHIPHMYKHNMARRID